MAQHNWLLSRLIAAFIVCAGYCYYNKHAFAKLGTQFEIGRVWYDQQLGNRSDRKLEGSLSTLGIFYPIPFDLAVDIGLNYSLLTISKEVFIIPPADARLETLGAEINLLYPFSPVLDFVLKLRQSIRSNGSYRYEDPAELVQIRSSGNQLMIGTKYLLVPVSKLVFGLAMGREVFKEEGAEDQKLSSRSLHFGFELLF